MNRVAIVTGGAKGIGLACARRFCEDGYKVVIADTDDDAMLDAEDTLSMHLDDVRFVNCDVSDALSVHNLVAQALDHFGQIDVLINNAGIFIPGAVVEEADGALEAMIETNLYSAYHLTRALLPVIPEGEGAHIFNICSIASQIAYPNGGSYSISKFALLGFSKVLREELKPKGIKVTSILPGATWSASWAGVELPESRLMQATDISKTVWAAYQLSDAAVVEEVVIRPQLGDL